MRVSRSVVVVWWCIHTDSTVLAAWLVGFRKECLWRQRAADSYLFIELWDVCMAGKAMKKMKKMAKAKAGKVGLCYFKSQWYL